MCGCQVNWRPNYISHELQPVAIKTRSCHSKEAQVGQIEDFLSRAEPEEWIIVFCPWQVSDFTQGGQLNESISSQIALAYQQHNWPGSSMGIEKAGLTVQNECCMLLEGLVGYTRLIHWHFSRVVRWRRFCVALVLSEMTTQHYIVCPF